MFMSKSVSHRIHRNHKIQLCVVRRHYVRPLSAPSRSGWAKSSQRQKQNTVKTVVGYNDRNREQSKTQIDRRPHDALVSSAFAFKGSSLALSILFVFKGAIRWQTNTRLLLRVLNAAVQRTFELRPSTGSGCFRLTFSVQKRNRVEGLCAVVYAALAV